MTAAAVRFESHRLTHPSTSPPPESMVERRYTEEEEALEIKSLRRIIAAYAKYAHPSRLSLLPWRISLHSFLRRHRRPQLIGSV